MQNRAISFHLRKYFVQKREKKLLQEITESLQGIPKTITMMEQLFADGILNVPSNKVRNVRIHT
jgi:hypothetical protein